jgi:hypothetical protein
MGRSDCARRQSASTHAVDRELRLHVTLAVGMPANERMDALIEKATELGVARCSRSLCDRSVLRLAGERAQNEGRPLARRRGGGQRAMRPHAGAGGRRGHAGLVMARVAGAEDGRDAAC